MDFAAALREALRPVWTELRNQSEGISRLTEEIVALKSALGGSTSPRCTQSYDSPKVSRKPLIQTKTVRLIEKDETRQKGLERTAKKQDEERKGKPDAATKRISTLKTSRSFEKLPQAAARKPTLAVKSPDQAKKRSIIRKSFIEKKLIEKVETDEEELCEESKCIETEPAREEMLSVEIAAQTETLDTKESEITLEKDVVEPLLSVVSVLDFESNARFASLDRELRTMMEAYGEQALLVSSPFQLSPGASGALSLLNTLDESQLYVGTQPKREEVYLVFRLFFQLTGQTLSEDREEAWKRCREFLQSDTQSNLEEKVLEAVSSFVFSNSNIDLLEVLLGSQSERMSPSLCSSFCTLSGLLLFPVKEGLIYAGLVPEKVRPWRRYQRLLYKRCTS